MKTIINTVKSIASSIRTKVQNTVIRCRCFTRRALQGNAGEGYIDTAIFS